MKFIYNKIVVFVLLTISSLFFAQDGPEVPEFEEPTSAIDMYVILLAVLAIGLVYVATSKNTKKI